MPRGVQEDYLSKGLSGSRSRMREATSPPRGVGSATSSFRQARPEGSLERSPAHRPVPTAAASRNALSHAAHFEASLLCPSVKQHFHVIRTPSSGGRLLQKAVPDRV